MKLNRLMLAGLLSLSLSATSAYACDHGGSRDDDSQSWFSSSFWQHLCGHDHDSDRDNDHDRSSGHDGHQCNGGSHNGGSGSGSSGSGSGGSSSGGGSSTTPVQYK